MGFLLRVLINAAALWVAASLIPGIALGGLGHTLLAALVLGIINAVVRPILIFLTLPITLVTLGLFIFVLNAFCLWLTSRLVPGVDISGLPQWNRWTLTVTSDGKALQETQRSPRGSPKGITRRSVRLTRGDLERLVTTVRASNFYFMAPDYAFEVSHASALVLRISLDARYHEVTVYAPDKLKHDPEVAAFLRIWNDLVTLVPPPNPGQGTE